MKNIKNNTMVEELKRWRAKRKVFLEMKAKEDECYQARKVLECKTKIIKGLEELEPYNNVLKMDGMCEPYVIALKQMKLKEVQDFKVSKYSRECNIYFRV